MLSFSRFVLVEAGDNPYDYKVDDKDDKQTTYTFNANGKPYSATVTHFGDTDADVTFGDRHYDSDFGYHTGFSKTGDQGLKAAKVMSTIHHIIRHHVAEHPKLKTIGFTSDTDEPSRVALYTRYAKRLGGHTNVSNIVRDTKVHIIPADSYRS